MRLKIAVAGLMMAIGAAALAMAQTAAPKDPVLIDTQGFQRILEKYKGQPLVMNMWATWCEPCRDEYPMLNDLAKQYAPHGLKVVGISMDQDGDLILMRRFLARYKPVFPNYRKKKGDEEAFTQAVMPGWNGSLPATFFYGRDGKQVAHVLGAGTREGFEAQIKAVLGK
jgi:thiol-disulfide isomerase/thioredoxin